jgi:murein DD-endopeptidase MepM/ murein hydrolase activator NlpD
LLFSKASAFVIQKDLVNSTIDTSKDWFTTPRLSEATANAIASKLLTTDSLYIQNWSNEAVFVHQNRSIAQLPPKIEIPLVDSANKFQLTWYGKLNSKYGERWGNMHKGLDLYLRSGDTVVSAFNGVVRYAKFNSGGFGNCVVVRHTNGLETIYGHLSKIDVTANQYVQAGELLGLGGTTGHSTGPHLHFETRYMDFAIDPEQYYNTQTGNLLSNTLVLERAKLNKNRYPTFSVKKRKKGRGHRSKSRSKKTSTQKHKTTSTSSSKKGSPKKKIAVKRKK